MPPASDNESFIETTVDGPRTRRWVLERGDCGEFNAHRITRLGIEEAVAPYRRVRMQPAGSFFLACIEGEGRILLDGRWQRVTPGALCMAPPRVLNAFYAATGKRWVFAWLRYEEPHWVRPLVGAASPVRSRDGGTELARSIMGLREEWAGQRNPKIIHHWVSLVQAFAHRAARPVQGDDRLAGLWAMVENSLGDLWTLERLATKVHLSTEHLRRRCHLEMGRSPIHQVTYMRMQRAQTLLETTDDKLEVIAQLTGYSDALVFSRAFKRWIGLTPSEYRSKR
jgi:AraC-like DNA-binding protein